MIRKIARKAWRHASKEKQMRRKLAIGSLNLLGLVKLKEKMYLVSERLINTIRTLSAGACISLKIGFTQDLITIRPKLPSNICRRAQNSEKFA